MDSLRTKSYWSRRRAIRKNVQAKFSACLAATAISASATKTSETSLVDTDSLHSVCQPDESSDNHDNHDNHDNDNVDDCQCHSVSVVSAEDKESNVFSEETESVSEWQDDFENQNEAAFDSDSDTNASDELLLNDHELDEADDERKTENLSFELGIWASSYGISHLALSALLSVLRIYHPFLPKDPRTLLKTPRHSIVRAVQGGSYFHFGVLNSLAKCKKLIHYLLSQVQTCFEQISVISLQINIDGLPLFKSASTQFWPILARVSKPVETEPFMVGLFCGEQKPVSPEEYLHDFVQEMLVFERGPVDIAVDEQKFPVHVNISCVICDTPARSYVKQSKGHSGYYGCDKCIQKGEWVGKMTFPDTDCELRTDESFRYGQESGDAHHNGDSPFRFLSVGMVTQFPIDYMHLVCLGVTRRLLLFWLKSPVAKGARLSHAAIRQISECLQLFKVYIPREFSRKCRGLNEVERWKATEFRQFLLYSGIVALKGKLSQVMYDNFLLLFVAIHCLASPELFESHADYAHMLLCRFVQSAKEIYGSDFLVYNVHGLTHLANDVKMFGPLDSYSSFRFENFLGHLKHLVRKPQFPLQQVMRRISERIQQGKFLTENTQKTRPENVPQREHHNGPIPDGFTFHFIQFQQIIYKGIFFSNTKGNNCVQIHKNFYLIRNILAVEGVDDHILLVERFNKIEDFFDHPFQSSFFDIVQAAKLSSHYETRKISEINRKCLSLPYKETYILLPLNHRHFQ